MHLIAQLLPNFALAGNIVGGMLIILCIVQAAQTGDEREDW